MAIVTIAKILDDIDFLGSSGRNTGFVINGNQAEVVCVDPGLGLRKIKDTLNSKDITIGSVGGFYKDPVISFSKLTAAQKNEFIKTLYKFIHCENLLALVEFLVRRGGSFNSKKDMNGKPIILLDDDIADTIIKEIMTNIEVLNKTYYEELIEYEEIEQPAKIIPLTEFNITMPKIEEKTQLYTSSRDDWWPILSPTNLNILFENLVMEMEMEMLSSGVSPQ